MPEYVKLHDPWEDLPSEDTPANAAAFGYLEEGIRRASVEIVTALPALPAHGDEIYYEVESGLLWHLIYDSTIVGDDKWVADGSLPLFNEVTTSQTTTSTSYANLATTGPSVTVPLDGDYEVEWGCHLQINPITGNRSAQAAVKRGAAAAADADAIDFAIPNTNALRLPGSRKRPFLALSAADVLLMQYKVSADTGNFSNRWLSVKPLRVG